MTTERNESTCPGPNGNGCDCKAEGKDPLCPWWPLHPEDVADESPAARIAELQVKRDAAQAAFEGAVRRLRAAERALDEAIDQTAAEWEAARHGDH